MNASTHEHEEPAPISETGRRRRRAFGGVVVVLGIGLALVLAPLTTPIVFGLWVAHISRPLFDKLSRHLRGSRKAAAAVTLLFILVMAMPIVLVVTTLVPAAKSLHAQLGKSGDLFGSLVSGNSGGGGEAVPARLDLMSLAKEYGASASKIAGAVLSTSTDIAVGLFIFFTVLSSVLINGERATEWVESHAPVDRSIVRRLSKAFYQTGRGLLIGTGGTALGQGLVSAVIYVALGIPRAALLAFLTSIAAIIPVAGSALVWVPVAIGLILTGQLTKGLVLIALGAIVVGSFDNLLRPWLSKRAQVGLPTVSVLISMFGGIAIFGAWGLFLGPLVAKLAVEALEIARERHLLAD